MLLDDFGKVARKINLLSSGSASRVSHVVCELPGVINSHLTTFPH